MRACAGSLAAPGLAQFQGPALLAFNDAVFSEADFQSISNIGNSMKRDQKGKTGRFGVGFNSIYHVSDVPSFASGKACPAMCFATPADEVCECDSANTCMLQSLI